MNKKRFSIKILCAVVSLILTTFIIGSNFSFAVQVKGTDTSSAGGSSTPSGSSDININEAFNWTGDGNIVNTTQTVMGTIITVIRTVATGIAIIMLTYVAIKYMSAAPSDKADFKKSATGFIVGAVVLFATSGILGVIQRFATENIK